MESIDKLLQSKKRVLITGGAGFIGGALIRRLLKYSNFTIFNLDKISYASDLTSIERIIKNLEEEDKQRYFFLKCDLADFSLTEQCLSKSNPDIVFHLAAESHVDRSISSPANFIQSNINGTYHLLQATKKHYHSISIKRKENFRFHHISTDEVFGSLDENGFFNEDSPYDPRSPYSASKASSDHLVKAWFHTFGLPVITTNCSNNYGPWQFPEKFIPIVIYKALRGERIPIYGDGSNIRDWLYIEDHIDALILTCLKGDIGSSYCIGGSEEKTNNEIAKEICSIMDKYKPNNFKYSELIQYVQDRPGHDYRYSIDARKIKKDLGWFPKNSFKKAIEHTVKWYLKENEWVKLVLKKSGYKGNRIGI